jgi:hypothetical protein
VSGHPIRSRRRVRGLGWPRCDDPVRKSSPAWPPQRRCSLARQKLGTRHAFSPPHWEERTQIVYIVLQFTGSLSKPPAAAYAQRASSTLSTIPAGLVDIGTVAPSQSETSQRSRFEICPSWQIRDSSLELCLTPQAVTRRAEVSDLANYTTQPNTVSCGIAAPISRVFHTPPMEKQYFGPSSLTI